MPQPRVLDLSQSYEPEQTGVEKFFNNVRQVYKEQEDQNTVDRLIKEYKSNRENANAYEDLQLGLEQSNISPTKRLQTQQSLNEMKKMIIEQDKALNGKFRNHVITDEERVKQKENLVKSGMPDWEAEVYLDAPPSVKAQIEKTHHDLSLRGIRQPLPSQEQSIAPEPTKIPQESPVSSKEGISTNQPPLAQPGPSNAAAEEIQPKEMWPNIAPPAEQTPTERNKWKNDNQKANQKTLAENHPKLTAIRDDKILIRNMQKLNDSKKLPSGSSKWITVNPETGDVRAIAKLSDNLNPETQAYIKDVNKFIKHAKDYFGARVTNFDLASFMSQLPTLSNNEQGRRLILKQMQLESELQGIYANKVDEAIKHYGRDAGPIDIAKVVDNQIKEEENDLIRKMDLTVEASAIATKMINNPTEFKDKVLIEKDGQFLAIPKTDYAEAEKDGWSIY